MTASATRAAPRSSLSVPGSSPRMLEKAMGLDADELVFDLEDAVAPDAKDEARAAVVAALRARPDQAGRIAVRVNAPRTPWCHLDLVALAEAEVTPASVVLPKTEDPGDLAFAERLLEGVEARRATRATVGIQALVESARGLSRATLIASASPRLEALILGYADLAASLGRRPEGGEQHDASWDAARDTVLTAARSCGLRAVDGPFLGIAPDDAFLAAARRARALGFDGKWAIHPSQIAALNELFSPSEAEVERARRIVGALAEAEAGGAGAVSLDGEMLDEAVRRRALDVLARAQRPAGHQGA